MIQLSGGQLIKGEFVYSSPVTFSASNRLTAQPVTDVFYEATASEVNEACTAAAAAFDSVRKMPGSQKADFLEAIATEIEALGDQLIEQANIETGLPLPRLQGERGRTTGQLKLFANLLRNGDWVQAVIDPAQPERKPAPRPDLRSMQIALGPVAVFGASNFPFAFSVAGGDTASALAAGCPVIFKAHPAHPATCELVAVAIANAIQKTGMPPGVFGMVHGASHQVGTALVEHPQIKAVGFTGSFRGGKALYDAAAKRTEPIPVYAEMGSVNPVFFLPRILRQKGGELAKQFAASITLGVGQFCTNPGLFVFQKEDHVSLFTEAVSNEISAAQQQPMLSDAISESYVKGLQTLGRLTGVELSAGNATPQVFMTDTAAMLQHGELSEEVFGPCSVGIAADNKHDMLVFAASLKGQLTATIHGTPDDLEEYKDLLELLQLKAGRLVINGFPTGVEVGHAMVHGGPYPATTDSRSTSVGSNAIYRFTRPVCFQDFPENLLPPELQTSNPLGIFRKVDGQLTR